MRAVIRCGKRPFFAMHGITCYILRGRHGDLLIDTGLPLTWFAMSRWLAEFDVRYLLLTHAHYDHDSNAAKLQRTGVKILLHERDSTLRGAFLSQRQQATLPHYRLRTAVQAIGAAHLQSPPYTPDLLLTDDRDALRRLGLDADLIPLAGHTLGSVGVLAGGVLYCGDAFTALSGGPQIPPNVHDIDMECAALERILALRPRWLACGHGLPVRMAKAEPVIRAYLQMRSGTGCGHSAF